MTTIDSVFRLTFRSQLTVVALSRRETIASILEVSHRTNTGLGVTGALLIWQECVVETLEGHEDTVLALYTKIARDGRHEACTLLHAQHVDTRLFDRWSIVRPAARSTSPWTPS